MGRRSQATRRAARQASIETLAKPATVIASLSQDRLGGEPYDRGWAERAKATLW